MFTEICQKVYFAVDDYSEIEYILANGYLSYMFSESVVVDGVQEHQEHHRLCRRNFYNAFPRLPLLLPSCTEVVALWTLGVRIPPCLNYSKSLI